jgi:hypothetical protein
MAELKVTFEQLEAAAVLHAFGSMDSTTAAGLREPLLRVVRGLHFLQTEQPGAVNELISELLHRVKKSALLKSADLTESVDDDQSFLLALMRRFGALSPLRAIEFEFAPAMLGSNANIEAERLDDVFTNLMEGMAGMGVTHIRIATPVASGRMEIRLSSREPTDPAAFGKRRPDRYNRTVGWLRGSLECSQDNGRTEFVMRLPALQAI